MQKQTTLGKRLQMMCNFSFLPKPCTLCPLYIQAESLFYLLFQQVVSDLAVLACVDLTSVNDENSIQH